MKRLLTYSIVDIEYFLLQIMHTSTVLYAENGWLFERIPAKKPCHFHFIRGIQSSLQLSYTFRAVCFVINLLASIRIRHQI